MIGRNLEKRIGTPPRKSVASLTARRGGSGYTEEAQAFYDAIKAAKSTCQVIGNTIGDINLDWYPYDIGSNEEYFSLDGDAATWAEALATTRSLDGTDYYMPQELIVNLLDTGKRGSWYWSDGVGLRSQSAINTMYTNAVNNGANFMCSLAPDTDGNIASGQFSLIENLATT